MSETTSQNDDGRTENKRFENTVSGDKLIVGDRIDTSLVARTFGELGTQKQPTYPEDDSEQPQTQLVVITQLDSLDDVHHALLADVDTGTIIRAGRHSSQSAWSQKEADWTVYDIGTTMRIDSVKELEVPRRDDEDIDEIKYVQDWVDMVIEDPANGHYGFNDIREIPSYNNIKIRDADGRKAYASYSLERKLSELVCPYCGDADIEFRCLAYHNTHAIEDGTPVCKCQACLSQFPKPTADDK